MSASMVQKLSESVRGSFENFLVAECLVRDICKDRHKATSAKTQNRNTNLIRSKLVYNISTKSYKEHNQSHKIML